jgi:hypothetical protein
LQKKKLKAKVWKKFSEYIRLKECLETTGTLDYGICVTCNKRFHYSELQAGHFIDGRSNSVLFVEDLVHIQCYHCNCVLSGNKDNYAPYMIKRYGIAQVEKMYLLKHMNKSLSVLELEAIYQDLVNKIKDLKNDSIKFI